jgi:hypothetical protein
MGDESVRREPTEPHRTNEGAANRLSLTTTHGVEFARTLGPDDTISDWFDAFEIGLLAAGFTAQLVAKERKARSEYEEVGWLG